MNTIWLLGPLGEPVLSCVAAMAEGAGQGVYLMRDDDGHPPRNADTAYGLPIPRAVEVAMIDEAADLYTIGCCAAAPIDGRHHVVIPSRPARSAHALLPARFLEFSTVGQVARVLATRAGLGWPFEVQDVAGGVPGTFRFNAPGHPGCWVLYGHYKGVDFTYEVPSEVLFTAACEMAANRAAKGRLRGIDGASFRTWRAGASGQAGAACPAWVVLYRDPHTQRQCDPPKAAHSRGDDYDAVETAFSEAHPDTEVLWLVQTESETVAFDDYFKAGESAAA